MFKSSQTVVEGLKDTADNIPRAVRVLWLVLLVQNNINLKEWELRLWSSKSFNLLSGIVGICDISCVSNDSGDWQKGHNAVHKTMH